MSREIGLRVVRGPDWKWGDQDGGEGYVGTVIPTSEADLNELGPRTVTVLWDSGLKATYQGGPKGSYDLRIVNNAASGVKHPNIPCGDDSCWVQEIQGIRWQCVTCGINLCTNCFIKSVPHNVEHVQFKRYYHDRVTRPSIVSCWSADGPDRRIELKGIFPGAIVSMGPEWPYGREGEKKRGLVMAAPKEEVSGKVLVEWEPSKERSRHKRSDYSGKDSTLRLKEAGISGLYHSGAFPIYEVVIPNESPLPEFNLGDRVQIDPKIRRDDFLKMQAEHGGCFASMKEYIGAIGTVQFMIGSSVSVQFKTKGENRPFSWRLNRTVLKKLNTYSVNQVIRIRNDERTIRSIDRRFQERQIRRKMIGAIGRVTKVDEDNPTKLYIHFDDVEIYQWLSKVKPLPSGWMELLGSTEPAAQKELNEWVEKGLILFFDAIKRGDLRAAKSVHMHHSAVADARNEDGMTALHLACWIGYVDVVKWLLDEVKVNIEEEDEDGYLPIHYAVEKCRADILTLLIDRGVDLNSIDGMECTALHIAVSAQFTECSRLLIDAGCDINIQDGDGNTPLHVAILEGSALSVHLILPRLWINFELKNEDEFNVFHLAVVKDDLKAIELMMGQESVDDPLLEFMPDSKSTVLHYACTHKSYQVVKLLVDKSRRWNTPDGSPLLTKLLEVKNEFGMTALAIACHLKDPTLIELLVDAGADCKVLDQEGNTAILFAAISPADDKIPNQELAQAIFKVYQSLNDDPNFKDVENKAILSLIIFLMMKGCCVNTANYAGLTLSEVLLPDRGYPENIIELLVQFIHKSKKNPSSGSGGCMGRPGCVQPPAFQLSCPHRTGIYKACSKCVLLPSEKFKCGCPEEEAVSITKTSSSSSAEVSSSMDSEWIKKEVNDDTEEGAAKQINYVFKWISDGSKNGKVEDQMGNEYVWSGTRKDGTIGYRCTSVSVLGRKGRCTAVARRFIKSSKDGTDTIQLESQHKHPTVKRKAGCFNYQEGSPLAKRERSSANPEN